MRKVDANTLAKLRADDRAERNHRSRAQSRADYFNTGRTRYRCHTACAGLGVPVEVSRPVKVHAFAASALAPESFATSGSKSAAANQVMNS